MTMLKGSKTLSELENELEVTMRDEIENERQKKHMNEMHIEECICRQFYQEEIQNMISERRKMMFEEQRMKIVLKNEEIERQFAESKYNVLQSSRKLEKASKHVMRRTEIKRGTAARKKINNEINFMYEEDILARTVQIARRRKEQLQMLKLENISSIAFEPGGGDRSIGHYPKENEISDSLQRKEWGSRLNKASAHLLCKKLIYQQKEFEAAFFQKELCKVEEEIKSLSNKLVILGKEELRVDYIKKITLAKALSYEAAYNRALRCKYHCEHKCIEKLKILDKAEVRARWMDTKVLTRFNQRWETTKLQNILHNLYFKKLMYSIIYKAEFEVTKKVLNKLEETISKNKSAIIDKKEGIAHVCRKFRRHEHLMMYRSALGKIIFTRSRQKTLNNALREWKEFTRWKMIQKYAYKLKYTTIKQGFDLRNLYPEIQEKIFEQKENLENLSEQQYEMTNFQKLKSRVIECRVCKKYYTENINHCFACCFHPGKFTEYISYSDKQKNPQVKHTESGSKKRWSCCKKDEKNQGCTFQYHIAPHDGDGIYKQRLMKINAKDCLKLSKFNKDILESSGRFNRYEGMKILAKIHA